MAPAPEVRALTLVDEPMIHGPRHVRRSRVVAVVPGPLAREGNVDGVVEVIVPLGVEAEPAEGLGAHDPRVVVRALRDQPGRATGPSPRRRCTADASSAKNGRALRSMSSWMASSRRPST